MDFDDYWQENKGFVTQVAAGLVAFLIGLLVLSKTVGAGVESAGRKVKSQQNKLSQARYSRTDKEAAADDNRALKAAVRELAEHVRFSPREGFRDPSRPTTPETYLAAVARVRDELLPIAGRSNVKLDETFGLPALSPTREDELERYLDGLDLVVSVLRLVIDERVSEVRSTRIKLDSLRRGSDGADLERTEVQFDMLGDNDALLRVLARSQSEFTPPLVIEEVEMEAERGSDMRARLRATFLVPRLGPSLLGDEDEDDEFGGRS